MRLFFNNNKAGRAVKVRVIYYFYSVVVSDLSFFYQFF
jgi:hypothetical protein